MVMQIYWTLFLALATLVRCQDLDSIMSDLNSRPQTTEMPSRPGVETCFTPENESGECVQFNLCVNNDTETDGSDIIDIRDLDGPCRSYLDVCCLPSSIQDQPKPSATPFVPREGCGWRNPNGVGMVTIGDVSGEAKFGEFPWMVAILTQADSTYIGGGSLIHTSVVVTGTHVVLAHTSPGSLVVRAGEWDTQTIKEPYPHQDRDVANVVVNKEYNRRSLANDIALLFLSKPMVLAPNVGLACLPSLGQVTLPGTRCLASGWGKDKFGEVGKYKVILKKLELPAVDFPTCQKQLRQSRLGSFFNLDPSFMCAGGESERDMCAGDGGSPLVCPLPLQADRYVHSGIVAWGIGCGGTLPGVYSDVARQRSWVDAQMIAAGYDTATYTLNM